MVIHVLCTDNVFETNMEKTLSSVLKSGCRLFKDCTELQTSVSCFLKFAIFHYLKAIFLSKLFIYIFVYLLTIAEANARATANIK